MTLESMRGRYRRKPAVRRVAEDASGGRAPAALVAVAG
jgi:hypothetical protein